MIDPALPLRQRRVFVDSSAYLALLDQDDEHQVSAVNILEQLARLRFRQFTTNTIVIEAHALILSSMGIRTATRFLQQIDRSNTVVVRVRASDEEAAKHIVYAYDDKDFSFADAISFVVMGRLHISYAFSFDRHFSQYGFTALLADN